jgi:hypothetical protein
MTQAEISERGPAVLVARGAVLRIGLGLSGGPRRRSIRWPDDENVLGRIMTASRVAA